MAHVADSDATNKAAELSGFRLSRSDASAPFLRSDIGVPFTVGGWVKFNVFGGFTHAHCSKFASSAGFILANSVHFGTANSARSQFMIGNGAGTASIEASSFGNMSTGVWYFVVAWIDPSILTMYIQVNDGTINSLVYGGNPTNATAAFQLGGDVGFVNQTLDGSLDSRFFARSILSAAVKTEMYNLGVGTRYCQLSLTTQALFDGSSGGGFWDLGEATGTTRIDSSTNGNDLTDNGGVIQVAGVTSGACAAHAPGGPVGSRVMMLFD